MYRILYNIPFWELCIGLFPCYTGWIWLRRRNLGSLLWKICHGAALLLWLVLTLYMTLFSRERGYGGMNLEPFWSYRLAFFEGSFDYFQEIYLNVLAFAIFGLIASELFQSRYWMVVLLALALSVGIEYLQIVLDVGLAEFDDIFSNTLGTILGVLVNYFSERYIAAVIRVGKSWIKSLIRYLHRHTTE